MEKEINSQHYSISAGIYIKKIGNQILRYINQNTLFSENPDATKMQMIFASYISNHNPCYQKDLEREFGIVAATASQILKHMENEKLLTRIPDENDARKKQLVLSDKGMEIGIKRNASIKQLDKAILKDIDSKKLDVFFEVLDQIKENVKIK
ncbi:MarR family winged helix-turn-helix transcriptional regulator [Mycoplasma sp. P36-A1]|uniref:MarR family winged helix-turn-helix transcriptional regulator n=1 Tax=Mycoplasma sp. P36-A1 TaxID=3252900 RepID=UPI003C2E51D4